MTIIFDLNRTLFDPETGSLVPGTLAVLEHFYTKGYPLHLVSKREGGRDELIDDFKLRPFFASVSFVEDKGAPIKEICEASEREVFVVGDYLRSEIMAGNMAGATTIWLRRGKFAEISPEHEQQVPNHIISELEELLSLIP
jgi:phosphoglycolate phosphatase-like HAD superfamily hydrolase